MYIEQISSEDTDCSYYTSKCVSHCVTLTREASNTASIHSYSTSQPGRAPKEVTLAATTSPLALAPASQTYTTIVRAERSRSFVSKGREPLYPPFDTCTAPHVVPSHVPAAVVRAERSARERLHVATLSEKALAPHKINIFYLHAPDRSVPFEDTLRAVNELYQEGRL